MALLGAALAQAPSSRQKQEEAALRATSRLVQVSVIVQDRNGAAVAGLEKDDFAILDGGQVQSISLFSMESRRALPAPAAPLPPGVYTNRPERRGAVPSSVTVILLDTLNTRTQDSAYGKEQIVRFLRQLQPQDHVALYVLSNRGVSVLHDFSSDPEPLLRALARFGAREEAGVAATDPESATSGMQLLDGIFRSVLQTQANFYLRDRVRRTVDALVAIASHLAALPGRKNLVWVSGSFPISYGLDKLGAPREEVVQAQLASDLASLQQGPGTPGTAGASSPGAAGARATVRPLSAGDPDLLVSPEKGVFAQDLERAARALNQAGLAIYPVDARGLEAPLPTNPFDPSAVAKNRGPAQPELAARAAVRQSFDTMNVLAERTGGLAFYNQNEIHRSVRQAVDDSSVTYELGYYPAHGKWDGRFREIEVQVKRPGLSLRHRRGYYAVPHPPAEQSRQTELLNATAAAPLEAAVLGLTVRLDPVAGAGSAVRNVRIEVDAREVALRLDDGRRTGALAVLLAQKKPDGDTADSSSEVLTLRLEPTTYDRLLRDGMKLNKQITLRPDAAELRVVLYDVNSGATGSVFVPLRRLPSGQ